MNNNTLREMHNSYILSANRIENWKEMTKTQLANGYCDAEDNNDMDLRDSYFSALMCKYWYMIPYIYNHNKGFRLDIEDFVEWIEESLLKGLSYRRWRDESFDISKDPDGAEKIFNRCIWSTEKRMYKWSNQEVRKINFETFSLDEICDKSRKKYMNLKTNSNVSDDIHAVFEVRDTTETNKEVERQDSRDTISSIVDYFVNKGDYLSALIIDSIAYGDSYKYSNEKYKVDEDGEKVEFTNSFAQFEPKRVVSMLNKLDENNLDYYDKNYKINREALLSVVKSIKTINNKKIYQKINTTLDDIKNNRELLEMLVKC